MVQVTEPIMQAMRHRMNADLMFHPATLGAEPSVFASDDAAAQSTSATSARRGTEVLLSVWLRLLCAPAARRSTSEIVR